MNQTEFDPQAFNRRDFLKGGSFATLMTMLGGVELLAQTNEPAPGEIKPPTVQTRVAVVGLGTWGREILTNLGRVPQADVVAICDSYPAFLKRASSAAPKALQAPDFKTILDNKEIQAVIIATPTHQHKDLVLAALKAGKHVYCEAPLANTIEDAKAIALAAKANPHLIFQAGYQMRAEPQRHFLLSFIRSGAVGKNVMARAQWHNKQSWRASAPNAEREKQMNWRLDKSISLGLIGEIGSHQIDQANWFLNALPKSVTGYGSLVLWTDGRDVDDTVQAVFEYPGGVRLAYDATLANSFDASYEMLFGSDAAVMMRYDLQGVPKAWLFKEVDSPLLGWEIYAQKAKFYNETGISLVANASKSVQQKAAAPADGKPLNPTLATALEMFLRNVTDLGGSIEDFKSNYGTDYDPQDLVAHLAKFRKRPTAGYLEAYQATVTAIKANEAIMGRKKIELTKDLYELA